MAGIQNTCYLKLRRKTLERGHRYILTKMLMMMRVGM